jgi:hypothetical protein
LDHIIVIIPEAWETIPQSKMTPVKWVAQQFIRKGAALGNYLWLDSQDIGGIDKTPLRQCDNWLMGRMKEAHEVERILKQLLGMKIAAEEIQTLALGHFYAAIGNDVKKVYVLPAGVPEDMGREVALGKRSPESVRDEFLKVKVMEMDDLVWKERFEQLQRDVEKRVEVVRQEAFKEALQKVDELKKQWNIDEYQRAIAELKDENLALRQDLEKLELENAKFAKFKAALAELSPTPLPAGLPTENNAVGLQATITIVDVAPAEKLVTINTDSFPGKILAVAKKSKLDMWRQLGEIVKAVEEEKWTATPQQVNNALNELVKDGLVAKKHTDRNYFCLAQGIRFVEARQK